MIVLIAGMPRSGSTFSFNIVRELLRRRGTVYHEPSRDGVPVIERSGTADHVIVKNHNTEEFTLRLVELGAIKAICTVRKPEDAIASAMEIFGFNLEIAINNMKAWLKTYARLRPHALTVPYVLTDQHPRRSALRIARHVCPDAGRRETFAIARDYSKSAIKTATDALSLGDENVEDMQFSFYRKDTLFHRRHVSSSVSRSAAERMGADAVTAVRSALQPYVDRDGNLL